MIAFIFGLFLGGIIGMMVMALVAMADSDEEPL